jgi:hypothetical protein
VRTLRAHTLRGWQEELTMSTVAHEPVKQAMNPIRAPAAGWNHLVLHNFVTTAPTSLRL